MMVTLVESRGQLDSLISQNSGNLLVVYTTQTCGYCRMLKSELEQLRPEDGISVLVFDVTNRAAEVADKDIHAVPHLELYHNSEFIRTKSGYMRRDELVKLFS